MVIVPGHTAHDHSSVGRLQPVAAPGPTTGRLRTLLNQSRLAAIGPNLVGAGRRRYSGAEKDCCCYQHVSRQNEKKHKVAGAYLLIKTRLTF